MHLYTKHGHRCCDEARLPREPVAKFRCGGPGLCKACSAEASAAHLTVTPDPLRDALAENERLRQELAKAEETIAKLRWGKIYSPHGRCRACGGLPNAHAMHCQHYVGPLSHILSFRDVNGTFGGYDWDCVCGSWVRQGGMAGTSMDVDLACPRAHETWRGPRPEFPGGPDE